MQMAGRRGRARLFVGLLPFAAFAGCSALWGIEDVSPLPGQAGAGGDAATGGFGGAAAGGGQGDAGAGAGGGTGGQGGAGAGGGEVGGAGGQGGAGAGGGGGAGGAPCEGRLVINEVQTLGPQSGADEFVELFNAGNCDAPLDGHLLSYLPDSGQNPITYWVPQVAGRVLAPGAFFVIAGVNYSGPRKDEFAVTQQGLAKNGAGLALFAGDVRSDAVAWGVVASRHPYLEGGVSAAIADNGQTIARGADGVDTDNNQADFVVSLVPSPGLPNPPP